jgi:hypothetical protein
MPANGTMMQYFHWYYGHTDAVPDLWERVIVQIIDAIGLQYQFHC